SGACRDTRVGGRVIHWGVAEKKGARGRRRGGGWLSTENHRLFMNISVIGTGYVGLVSGTCLAEKGHRVICVDVDEGKVARINRGEPPIYEKGLEDMLRANVGKRLEATTDLARAVRETDVSLIAVGTP